MLQTGTSTPRHQDLQGLTASDLIDLILDTHHPFARETLARITGAAPAVVAAWQERDPRLPKALEAIEALEAEMLLHLQREERVLFPILKEIEAAPETSDAEVGAMLGPIICMKREHGFIDDMLAYLRVQTDGFEAPAGAGEDYRQLLRDLAAFESDTCEHVRKENEILFPKAMEMAPPVR